MTTAPEPEVEEHFPEENLPEWERVHPRLWGIVFLADAQQCKREAEYQRREERP